jgi:hypothetical protein
MRQGSLWQRLMVRGLLAGAVVGTAEVSAHLTSAAGWSLRLPGSMHDLLSQPAPGGFMPVSLGLGALVALTGLAGSVGRTRSRQGRPTPLSTRRPAQRMPSRSEPTRQYVRLERLLLPGERVYHPSYGAGMVISLTRNEDDLEVRVAFDQGRVERFFAANQPTEYRVIEGGKAESRDLPDVGYQAA